MIEIEMNYKKSTKGTHVYSDESSDSPVPSLYIKRVALPTEPPKTIKVSIEMQS